MLFTDPDFLSYTSFNSLGEEFLQMSDITPFESAFLSGLIKKNKPKKILEIGVSYGGSSSLILKTLKEIDSSAHLFSVDLNSVHYANPNCKTGCAVSQLVPELMSSWTFLVDNVYPFFADEIGSEIDFLFLDSAHLLPGELIDFIAVLPYLSPSATVVLHDTNLHHYQFRKYENATKVLLDTVVADKIILKKQYDIPSYFANIAAFNIITDTKKYIDNLFLATCLNWAYLPEEKHIDLYIDLYKKHYQADMVEYFELAYNANLESINYEKYDYLTKKIERKKEIRAFYKKHPVQKLLKNLGFIQKLS